jgi:hypothetical protein
MPNALPKLSQLEAAIEGAKHMPEVSEGAGRVISPGDPIMERAETPEEIIKRETAVFKPGTHGKKP